MILRNIRDYFPVLPISDQTREATQPIKVHPVKILTRIIPKILLHRLAAAIIVGRK